MDTRELGKLGEDLAAEFLTKRGWRILARNLRLDRAELDIVAKDRDTTVFVEVKTRRSFSHGLPGEAVNRRKQQQIIKAAQLYLLQKNCFDAPCRFDVVEVFFRTEYDFEINLISGAFET